MATRTPARRSASSAGRSTARAQLALAAVTPISSPHLNFNKAFALNPLQAQKITMGMLTANRPGIDKLKDAGQLVNAISVSGDRARRRTLIAGFRQARSELALVHQMALLPEEQAEAFIKDYLDDGGDLASVFQWLGMAGAALNAPRSRAARAAALRHWGQPGRRGARAAPKAGSSARATSRGFFGDVVGAVGGAISSVGGAIGGAINSVVNAVTKAGKSLADAISSTLNWTVAQLRDLVTALVRAGKRVGDILAAALTKGVAQLQKFVEAVLGAGRSVFEVLSWGVGQVASAANAVVAKLVALGKAVADLVLNVVALGRSAMVAVLRGLMAVGKRLFDLLTAVANQGFGVIRAVVDALLAAGQLVRSVLADAVRLATTACRHVVNALLQLGRTVKDLVSEALAAAGTVLRLLLQTLAALGRSVAEVLAAAAALAAASVRLVVQTLIALGHTVAALVQTVATQAIAVAKAVFTALLALGHKVVTFLVALAGRTLSALRTALEALLAMGLSLASLVKDICTGVVEAFRRGFFEGLIALGKAPLQLLKAAAEAGVSVVLLAFTVLLEVLGGYKPLSEIPGAMDQARKVFGTSIQLDRVKIGFAALPGDVMRLLNIEMPRAFTTMYLLNFGPGAKVDMQTIIHELAHVWQGVQEGPLYMTRALEAQIGAGLDTLFHEGTYDDSASYLVTDQMLIDAAGDFKKFNPEQQATIIEAFWVVRFAGEAVAPGPYPTTALVGGFSPPLELVLPYAQVVNPALGAGRQASGRRKAVAAKKAPARKKATPRPTPRSGRRGGRTAA
ncbi:MAG: hypothetical protein JNJ89_16470 [Rubrivivax sp.]|nr:hypothetical protein [Rubrivivax sp.]